MENGFIRKNCLSKSISIQEITKNLSIHNNVQQSKKDKKQLALNETNEARHVAGQ